MRVGTQERVGLDWMSRKNSKQQIYSGAMKKGMSPLQVARMREIANKAAEEGSKKAAKQAFIRMLAIPVGLLAEDYWPKTAKKKVPQFIDDCLSLYDSYEKGVVTMEELTDYLWEYGGVRLEDLQKACDRD